MATHSSTLAWQIPWTEETGRLQFMGLQRVRHDWAISLSLSETLSMLLLLLSHFGSVRLCATPSPGFSIQEYWSGLPFPSPMHNRERWKWSRSVMSDSSRSLGLQPTSLLRPWHLSGTSTGVGCHCLLRTLSIPSSKVGSNYSLQLFTYLGQIFTSGKPLWIFEGLRKFEWKRKRKHLKDDQDCYFVFEECIMISNGREDSYRIF